MWESLANSPILDAELFLSRTKLFTVLHYCVIVGIICFNRTVAILVKCNGECNLGRAAKLLTPLPTKLYNLTSPPPPPLGCFGVPPKLRWPFRMKMVQFHQNIQLYMYDLDNHTRKRGLETVESRT